MVNVIEDEIVTSARGSQEDGARRGLAIGADHKRWQVKARRHLRQSGRERQALGGQFGGKQRDAAKDFGLAHSGQVVDACVQHGQHVELARLGGIPAGGIEGRLIKAALVNRSFALFIRRRGSSGHCNASGIVFQVGSVSLAPGLMDGYPVMQK